MIYLDIRFLGVSWGAGTTYPAEELPVEEAKSQIWSLVKNMRRAKSQWGAVRRLVGSPEPAVFWVILWVTKNPTVPKPTDFLFVFWCLFVILWVKKWFVKWSKTIFICGLSFCPMFFIFENSRTFSKMDERGAGVKWIACVGFTLCELTSIHGNGGSLAAIG